MCDRCAAQKVNGPIAAAAGKHSPAECLQATLMAQAVAVGGPAIESGSVAGKSAAAAAARSGRSKLWELETELHCSVIGTCVPLEELRKIYQRVQGAEANHLHDYAIHGLFVSSAASPHAGIRLVNKYLDRAYRTAVQRFNRARTDTELAEQWQAALDSGDIAGAYWALLTHPKVSPALVKQAFGDVHMLSHLAGRNVQAEKRRRQALTRQCESQRQALADYSQRLQRLHTEQERTLAELQQCQRQLGAKTETCEVLQNQLVELQENEAVSALRHRIARLEQKLAQAEARHQDDWAERINGLEEDNRALREQLELRTHECEALTARLEMLLDDVSACPGQDQPDLCGRCILYVGGHMRAQAHFRKLVERLNGNFLHHDGGLEDGRKRLPVLLQRADAVICPVDCISHRAVNDIKVLCKREAKPMILLRKASFSAFNAALYSVAQ